MVIYHFGRLNYYMEIRFIDLDPQKVAHLATKMIHPYRSPKTIGLGTKSITEDKVFCDLGCGEGDVMSFVEPYAKKVIGFEFNQTRAQPAINRGYEVIIGDWHKDDLPDADVYYAWPGDPNDFEHLIQKVLAKSAKLMMGGRKDHAVLMKEMVEKYKGYILEFPYSEDHYNTNWEEDWFWWVGVVG